MDVYGWIGFWRFVLGLGLGAEVRQLPRHPQVQFYSWKLRARQRLCVNNKPCSTHFPRQLQPSGHPQSHGAEC
jgi:hypothetical protein